MCKVYVLSERSATGVLKVCLGGDFNADCSWADSDTCHVFGGS